MGEIIIRYLNMSPRTKAFTATDENGDYNIYVNTRYDSFVQQEAIAHEMRHIKGEHFFRQSAVAADEKEASTPDSIYTPRHYGQAHATPLVWDNQHSTPRTDFRQLRLSAQLSTLQLAKLAGLAQSAYVSYERGVRPCPATDEQSIMSVLEKYK